MIAAGCRVRAWAALAPVVALAMTAGCGGGEDSPTTTVSIPGASAEAPPAIAPTDRAQAGGGEPSGQGGDGPGDAAPAPAAGEDSVPTPDPGAIEEAEARAGEVYDGIREASADAIRSGDADELAALREQLEARRDELCERPDVPARLCRESRD